MQGGSKKINKRYNKERFNATKLFLTYAQCDLPRETVKSHVEVVCGQLREFIVAQEHHQDGGKHLHGAFWFNSKQDMISYKRFDIEGFHPNVKNLRLKADFDRAYKYCQKEDMNNINSGYKPAMTKEERNNELLCQIEEEGLPSLLRKGEISLYHYANLKKSYLTFKEDEREDTREDLPTKLENPWFDPLPVNMDLKLCHYWLFSRRPSLGKTTWASQLQNNYRSTTWNYQEMCQPQIKRDIEMIIMDEFRGQIKATHLNSLCDGTAWITGKYRDPWKLDNKPMIIILSNCPMEEIYKDLDLDLISARFQQLEIMNFRL